MKKAILISIRPEGVKKIIDGEKIIEIRKIVPKCELPIDVYIYCTKGRYELYMDTLYHCAGFLKCSPYDELLNGKVVAKFTLKKTVPIHMQMGIPNGYGDNGYIGYAYCEEDDFRWWYEVIGKACLREDELCKYLNGGKTLKQVATGNLKAKTGYAWHISTQKVF